MIIEEMQGNAAWGVIFFNIEKETFFEEAYLFL